MKRSKGLSLKTTTALIVIILLLGIGTTAFLFGLYKVALVQTFDIKIRTTSEKVIGFSADPYLDFGTLPAGGGTSRRDINTHNPFKFPVLVRIISRGEAAPYVKFADNEFILQPDEYREIGAFAVIPGGFNRNATMTGTAKVIYLRN